MIAKTNHKVDDFFRRKPTQVNLDRPMKQPKEEKKQEAPRGEAVEYIDNSRNPQPSFVEQPAEMRTTGILRVQVVEESKMEVFLTAKDDDPMQKREQFVLDQRNANRKEKISKKR